MQHLPTFSPRDGRMSTLKKNQSRPSSPDLGGDVPPWMPQKLPKRKDNQCWGALNPSGTKLPAEQTQDREEALPEFTDLPVTADSAATTRVTPTPGSLAVSGVGSPSISPPCSPTVSPKNTEFDLPGWMPEAIKRPTNAKGWACFGTEELPREDLPKLVPKEDPPEIPPWINDVPCPKGPLRGGWGGHSLPVPEAVSETVDLDDESAFTLSDGDLPGWMPSQFRRYPRRAEGWGVLISETHNARTNKEKKPPTQVHSVTELPSSVDIDIPAWIDSTGSTKKRPRAKDAKGWAVLTKSADMPLPTEKDRVPVAPKESVFARSDNVVKRAVRPVERVAKSLEAGDEREKEVGAVVPIVDIAELHNQIKQSNVRGVGGSGTVYEVSYKGQQVALKMLNSKGPSGREAFVRELNMLSNLNSSYLVKLVAACIEPPCYITPYYPLGSLDYLMRLHPGGLEMQLCLSLARDILKGLIYLHSRKIIHRDLKPANILLADSSSGMRAKITDLGSARELGTTMTSQVGTFAYMAPELLEGKSAYGTDVDIYSFAFILYEMLRGSNPLIEMSVSDLCDFIRSGRRPPFDQREIPETLKAVVRACWQPSNRPSAESVLGQLDSKALGQ